MPLIALLALAAPASAQRILDWPLRTAHGPEGTSTGVEAAFWNPAAISAGGGRGEFIVADQHTPELIGIGGFAAAAAWRLDARTTLAAGYQHVAVDEMDQTSTSPLPEPGELPFSVADDRFAVGAGHALSPHVRAGIGVRYERSNEWLVVDPNGPAYETSTSLAAGFLVTPTLPLHPVIGASLQTRTGGGVKFVGAVELLAPPLTQGLEVRAGYGLRGDNEQVHEHRLSASAMYRGLIIVSAGMTGADAGGGQEWQPLYAVGVRVSRYELSAVRESLSNEFGAAWSLRFRLGLK